MISGLTLAFKSYLPLDIYVYVTMYISIHCTYRLQILDSGKQILYTVRVGDAIQLNVLNVYFGGFRGVAFAVGVFLGSELRCRSVTLVLLEPLYLQL